MKLFIKERGASVKAQFQWEARTNVAKRHTTPFVWKFLLLNFFLYPQTWHSVSLCKFTFQIKAEKLFSCFVLFGSSAYLRTKKGLDNLETMKVISTCFTTIKYWKEWVTAKQIQAVIPSGSLQIVCAEHLSVKSWSYAGFFFQLSWQNVGAWKHERVHQYEPFLHPNLFN